MQEVTREIFYQNIRNWEDVPFSQSEGWVGMQSGNNASRVRYFMDEQIAVAAHVKHFAGLTMLYIDTECLRNRAVKPIVISRFYEALRKTDVDIIELNSRRIYNAEYEVGMRQAGFLRPTGSFSYEITNQIDLTQEIRYNENWKRNIKLSDNQELKLERIDKPAEGDITDFMRLYREMSANKQLTVPFSAEMIHTLLADPHFHLCFIRQAEKRLSAIIYHHIKDHAGLLYAANGDEANEKHAGFQLYKQLLEALQAEGVRSFDMEKMGASTHSTNAVFLFKQGIRGQLTGLCGEWCWYKRAWYNIGMYFIKKYVWKKTQA